MWALAHRLRKRFPALAADSYFPKRYSVVSTQVCGNKLVVPHHRRTGGMLSWSLLHLNGPSFPGCTDSCQRQRVRFGLLPTRQAGPHRAGLRTPGHSSEADFELSPAPRRILLED